MMIELLPASRFSKEELTELYNKTRVDYLVPMPMNADRLMEYVHDFDVDMDRSRVARAEDGQILGLCMLGVRKNIAWITRLGVLPVTRRHGTGAILMDDMLSSAEEKGMIETHLEVIRNNTPAYNLFLKKGFKETGEYLVMRRAPLPVTETLQGRAAWLDARDAVEILQSYPNHLTWINAVQSMQNAPDVEGLTIEMPNGGSGWLVFRSQRHTLRFSLNHMVIYTEKGNPEDVGKQLLLHLYSRLPNYDTYAENIHVNDPHLPAFRALGFFDNFSRIEMRRPHQNNVGLIPNLTDPLP